MRLSESGREFIKGWEGLRLKAYRPLPSDVWTIGWGHTSTAKEGMVITKKEAEELFDKDIAKFEECVSSLVTYDLSEKRFTALVSLAYNIGCSAFKSSTLLRKLNSGRSVGVPEQIVRWNKSGGKVIQGLVARRDKEAALWGYTPAVERVS